MASRRQFLAGAAAAVGTAGGAAALAEHLSDSAHSGGTGSAGTVRATGVGSSKQPSAAARTDRPNIILILHDDLGWGETGPYGQRTIATPSIDRVAAQGLRFTQYYGGGCVCAPSRSVALTGLHLGHATVRQNPEAGTRGSFVSTDTTFAQVLWSRGYRTGLFGKWGFGPLHGDQPSHPNNRGFDEFFGYISHEEAHHYYPNHLWHNAERIAMDGRTYAPPLFAERAIQFVKDNAGQPFLVYLAPNLPHAPSDVPDTGVYTDPSWTAADRGHAAQVALLDKHIGEIVDTVEQAGLSDNTLIMITGDHGPHEEGGVNPDFFDSNGPLRGYKRNLYEGGIRVPMIAWGPGRVPVGTTDRAAGHVDLVPTLAALAGTEGPRDVDGVSFAGVLTGTSDTLPHRDHFYWYRRDPFNTGRAAAAEHGSVTRAAEAIRRGDWKLVRIAAGHDRPRGRTGYPTVQLFDLATDPGESNDLAGKHPKLVSELTAALDADWTPFYPRVGYGLSVAAPERLAPGESALVTVVLSNGTSGDLLRAGISLTGPAGVTLVRQGAAPTGTIAPGVSAAASWELTVDRSGVAAPLWALSAEATAEPAGGSVALRYREQAVVLRTGTATT